MSSNHNHDRDTRNDTGIDTGIDTIDIGIDTIDVGIDTIDVGIGHSTNSTTSNNSSLPSPSVMQIIIE